MDNRTLWLHEANGCLILRWPPRWWERILGYGTLAGALVILLAWCWLVGETFILPYISSGRSFSSTVVAQIATWILLFPVLSVMTGCGVLVILVRHSITSKQEFLTQGNLRICVGGQQLDRGE